MSKIYVDEILPKDNAKITAADLQLPAGSVIQVQQVVLTSDVLTSSGSYVDSGLAITFTPHYTTSKLLVSVVCPNTIVLGSGSLGATVQRNHGTGWQNQFGLAGDSGFDELSTPQYNGSLAAQFLDTGGYSSIQYKVVFKNGQNSGQNVYLNSYTGSDPKVRATMTVMEIAQ